MVNQHIKWLKTSRELPWRAHIASLNHLLTSHVRRQDHNGFSHQDPEFVDRVLNESPEPDGVLGVSGSRSPVPTGATRGSRRWCTWHRRRCRCRHSGP
ncbi:hypothetical protein G9272_40920 [Streptomyces asoensis]|uniref:Xylulose 5-phosphate/Fructose 6-phosphate phosphoketolase N-terminal domain-containing protein n=1 Tax=Streptomyces asoensis TaxID=249586 RepID=A0A6M4X0Y0_9ACTN|nr:hypothetical protein G9272_40920 [Streptomyces asoensis]